MSKRQIVQAVEGERGVPHGREIRLSFQLPGSPAIPGILLLPAGSGATPAALLLHGYSSRKEEMSGPLGEALLAHGIASLSIDLVLHGSRADPLQAQSARNPVAMMGMWRQAIAEARLGVKYLAARKEIDADRLAVVGYSLGSFLSIQLAADEPMIRAVVLAAGGDLPEGTPLTRVARLAVDPIRAVRKLKGRPLLMVHGRNDRTVRPDQATRLFDAAGDPKEMRWFDAGHRLPPAASEEVAVWLEARMGRERAGVGES